MLGTSCCANCIHWDRRDAAETGWGCCALARSREGIPAAVDTLAFAQGGKGEMDLKTRADFHCCQHQLPSGR